MKQLTNKQVMARYRTAVGVIDMVAEESPVFNGIYQKASELKMEIEIELEDRGINYEEIELHNTTFITD